ncbi:hypothetical protein DC522_30970 [Microvirga sp. KLBC 81]|uniref:glycosyltransferase family 2 protein n=1 Tax=Microvirga sp. KLBC 81 TaxID=1862707 RepID=UPI000D512D0D|nr:glycosyltransferase family 2 protein [Microvirga sp. KLBC 81]PVE20653.1 hypothetical protein DC522_30970 [Microvirga sp. KLBC 81]
MSVSLLIRALNEAAHIVRLLEGARMQTRQPDEIILVDSVSTDGTVEIAERFGAKVVRIDRDLFIHGRAINIGVEQPTGDIIVLASAHVYPSYRDWIERIYEAFSDERVSLVYGRQVGDARTKLSEHRIFEQWFPARSVENPASYFCNNANCAVGREDVLRYPYDEYLTGVEDIAWAKALLSRGGRIVYDGKRGSFGGRGPQADWMTRVASGGIFG